MTTTIIWTIVAVTLLGLLLAVVLFLVAKKFKVEEDPRIDEVEKVMPGANCGGCGFAGCRAFAQACVNAPNLDNNFCPVGGNEVMKKVAAVLGMEVKEKAPMVAVVRCNGTCENRPKTNVYDGYRSCKVMAALYTGDTGCAYGCLGCGDCVAACQFGAISMDPETGLPVVDEEKCTGCGACAKACPKKVIELRNKGPKGRRVFVSCVNMEKGAAARKAEAGRDGARAKEAKEGTAAARPRVMCDSLQCADRALPLLGASVDACFARGRDGHVLRRFR